ncbi:MULTISPECIES: hypothetical protein [Kitasatospora]|nr:hypothetical protein [Kitasatospora sp. GP30]
MDESAQATGTRAHRLRESHRQAPAVARTDRSGTVPPQAALRRSGAV